MNEECVSLDFIREMIEQNDNIVLCGHTNPDGDAIGACLALGSAIELIGKKVSVLLEDYGGKYNLIPNKHLVVSPEEVLEVDLFISLDCGDKERFMYIIDVFERAKKTLNIDHHKSNTFFADYNYVDKQASSTCEMVYGILNGNFPVDEKIALALYTGLIFDTGGFRHSSATPDTMRIAGELMSYDIPFNKTYTAFFDEKSFSEAKLLGKAIDNMELLYEGKLVITTISLEEVEACKGSLKELDGVVNYIKGIQDSLVSCFIYQKTKDTVKASFRSEDGYDVAEFVGQFGGGGHMKAAGCTLMMGIEEAKAFMIEKVKPLIS